MPEHTIQLESPEPRWIAIVKRTATQNELSRVVPEGCGEVWNFIRATNLPHTGLNLALYRNGNIDLDCGVIVTGSFSPSDDVECSTTPTGKTARTEHYGPYHRLGEAHKAITEWCKKHNYPLTGLNWEIYDHWTDDPAMLHTTVYYELAADISQTTN